MSLIDNVLSRELRSYWAEALGAAHRNPEFVRFGVFDCCPSGFLPSAFGLGVALFLALPLALVVGWLWKSRRRHAVLLSVGWLLLEGSVIATDFNRLVSWTADMPRDQQSLRLLPYLAWAPIQIVLDGLALLLVPAMIAYGLRQVCRRLVSCKQIAPL